MSTATFKVHNIIHDNNFEVSDFIKTWKFLNGDRIDMNIEEVDLIFHGVLSDVKRIWNLWIENSIQVYVVKPYRGDHCSFLCYFH
jgi:hypothetical protein